MTKGPKDIDRLALLQKAILNQAVRLLKPTGRLLYATCTLSREENEGVVEGCLKENQGLALESFKEAAPIWARDLIDENGFFRTFPHIHGMEGFFGALFQKTTP